MKDKDVIVRRCGIVKDDLEGKDTDIDLSGESEEYKNGFKEALEWVLGW